MTDSSTEPTEFGAVLVTHAKGRAHEEATRKLREAVEAVQRTGKPASVTVKLDIKPVDKIPNAFKISDAVTAKIPEDPRTSMWFGDDNGGLHRNNPNQDELPYDTTPSDGKTAAAGKDN